MKFKEVQLNILMAMGCITILGSIYLLMGHNSVGFNILVGSISLLAGVMIKNPLKK